MKKLTTTTYLLLFLVNYIQITYLITTTNSNMKLLSNNTFCCRINLHRNTVEFSVRNFIEDFR